MPVLFTRSCEYGVQAVIYLARQPSGKLTLIKEVAVALQIPPHFLAKIMQKLSRAGILKSYRGRKGGFELGVAADQITPLQVIEAIDGLAFINDCVLGLHECSDAGSCPVHCEWADIRERVVEMLATKTIAEVAARVPSPDPLSETGTVAA